MSTATANTIEVELVPETGAPGPHSAAPVVVPISPSAHIAYLDGLIATTNVSVSGTNIVLTIAELEQIRQLEANPPTPYGTLTDAVRKRIAKDRTP